MAIAVESSDASLPTLWGALTTRLPPAWRIGAAPLSLIGAMLAVARMRREGVVLAFGTVGAGPRTSILLAGALGAGIGTLVPTLPTTHEWERIGGGWSHHGVVIADVPGTATRPLAPPARSAWPVVTSACGSALGAAVGLYAGVVSGIALAAGLLLADAVGMGLADRGGWFSASGVGFALFGITVIISRAPLFPGRHDR